MWPLLAAVVSPLFAFATQGKSKDFHFYIEYGVRTIYISLGYTWSTPARSRIECLVAPCIPGSLGMQPLSLTVPRYWVHLKPSSGEAIPGAMRAFAYRLNLRWRLAVPAGAFPQLSLTNRVSHSLLDDIIKIWHSYIVREKDKNSIAACNSATDRDLSHPPNQPNQPLQATCV